MVARIRCNKPEAYKLKEAKFHLLLEHITSEVEQAEESQSDTRLESIINATDK